ncbi:hypothetical protein BVRB_2g044230 [Beta vulgaris subsp. vulgaris]|nr:hypothetical protein BVRB_2g044230 [Beta vulgaris subsp. vulgaris]
MPQAKSNDEFYLGQRVVLPSHSGCHWHRRGVSVASVYTWARETLL